jgi:hypothetical protein
MLFCSCGVAYPHSWCEHSTGDDQVGKDKAGHAERHEDWLSGICMPVITTLHDLAGHKLVPGCSVDSIVFFASHRSGVISRILPVLYAVTSCFAFSRPAEDVNSVL